jgi:hypothetical protein
VHVPLICWAGNRELDVIDVMDQSELRPPWKMEDWVQYFNQPPEVRKRILNVISLEFSGTRLAHKVRAPKFVRKADWVDNVWPKELKERALKPPPETTNTTASVKQELPTGRFTHVLYDSLTLSLTPTPHHPPFSSPSRCYINSAEHDRRECRPEQRSLSRRSRIEGEARRREEHARTGASRVGATGKRCLVGQARARAHSHACSNTNTRSSSGSGGGLAGLLPQGPALLSDECQGVLHRLSHRLWRLIRVVRTAAYVLALLACGAYQSECCCFTFALSLIIILVPLIPGITCSRARRCSS